MSNPIVSVIIPTYNYGQYIKEALESVFEQSFKDLEIIIVDDGSTDNTKEVLASYKDRVTYFYQNRQGPAKARNKGIIESHGEFVAFLDADDIWLPTKLAKQVNLFHGNSPLGMVITENCLFDEKGTFKAFMGKRNYLLKGDIVANIFLKSGVATPTVMVRRNVFDKVGLFEESLLTAEDDNMWIRIAAEYDIDIVDEPLAKIRDHPTMTMRVHNKIRENMENSMQLLISKYGPKVTSRILPLISTKQYQINFGEGYRYLESMNNPEARRLFLKAINFRHGYWRPYIYIFITFIPSWFLLRLRLTKRKIMPTFISSSRWRRS